MLEANDVLFGLLHYLGVEGNILNNVPCLVVRQGSVTAQAHHEPILLSLGLSLKVLKRVYTIIRNDSYLEPMWNLTIHLLS